MRVCVPGGIVFLKNSCPPEPMNATVFGNRVFADTIKLR